MYLNFIHRGKPLQVSTSDTTTLQDIRYQVSSLLSVPDENVRLLSEGKLLSSADDHHHVSQLFRPSQTIMILATTAETAESIHAAQPDRTIRPFSARAPKYVAEPRKTHESLTEYGFGSCVALPNLPDSDKAQKILEQLASDRGFLAVMKKKRWNVGQLREMPPEGRVGVDPVCVLGYNTNKGQQIHLRLRTDDMKGFRAMYSIRQVLAHELAHNEFSEHDDNFKELMRWIERIAGREDWRSSGQQLSDGWSAPDFKLSSSDRMGTGQRDGHKVGSESGSTGVSRLLRAYDESHSSDVEKADDGVAEAGREILEATAADDENVNRRDETKSTEEKRTALDEVVSVGFSRQLASLALRENKGEAIRAVDWLLCQTGGRQEQETGAMGDMELETTRRTEEALNSLGRSVGVGELISALEALHVYMGNVLRHPNVERFCRINEENGGFRRRVGVFGDAIEVLRLAGFRLQEGFWRYDSLGASRVWIVKSG